MLRFIKQILISAMMFFSSLSSVNSLECISMKNQKCKVKPEIIDINSNDPIIFPFSIKINKCSDNCNNINNPYARICVPDVMRCDKSCDIGEYLDYSNCKCKKN